MKVTLDDVHKSFDTRSGPVDAIAGVDLSVGEGEVVAFVGASGCGKTTLLRMVAGLTAPSTGEVAVDGRPVWRGDRPDRDVVADLAVVFQDANLLPWSTVEANIALPLRLRGVGRAERTARARDLCELTGLAGFERSRPASLSGGMRQRVALARALVAAPRLLLLDEPFASLDAITRDAMNAELQRVWGHRPCTAVLVTHSITEAVTLADRVVTLSVRPGRIAGVVAVPFARPRPVELQHSAEFQELVREVRGHLVAAS